MRLNERVFDEKFSAEQIWGLCTILLAERANSALNFLCKDIQVTNKFYRIGLMMCGFFFMHLKEQ